MKNNLCWRKKLMSRKCRKKCIAGQLDWPRCNCCLQSCGHLTKRKISTTLFALELFDSICFWELMLALLNLHLRFSKHCSNTYDLSRKAKKKGKCSKCRITKRWKNVEKTLKKRWKKPHEMLNAITSKITSKKLFIQWKKRWITKRQKKKRWKWVTRPRGRCVFTLHEEFVQNVKFKVLSFNIIFFDKSISMARDSAFCNLAFCTPVKSST